jgi:cob(I)alamin adenosyltransferase
MVFTGDGKGKTTAAIGMGLRAAGHDMRVLMIQFIKNNWRYGELAAIQRLAPQFELVRRGEGFTWRAKDEADKERHHLAAREALALAAEAISAGAHEMIILDEVCTAVRAGLITAEDVLDLLQRRPRSLHLVFTGRGAPAALIDQADLVTEMRAVKHHYQQGVQAQKGVEF